MGPVSDEHDVRSIWPEGEKRRLTLLFCDLVGSTSIGQQLDAEEYADLIEAYVGQAAGAIESYGGYVSQVQGDGIVAYFGFPAARENDPERAVRAALAIHESLRRFSDGFGEARVRFQARVGIHTGPVVVNEVGRARRELLALGDTPNTAARVESVTAPGFVGISETTRRLVGDLFVLEAVVHHQVKGLDHPLAVYTVLGLAGDGGTAALPIGQPASEFVGRHAEHDALHSALLSAMAGDGRTIVVSGEAGIGKSRLANTIVAEAAALNCRVVTIKCSSHGGDNAFDPIVDLMVRVLDIPSGTDPQSSSLLIEQILTDPEVDPDALLPYILALLGLPASASYPLPVLGADLQRSRTIQAVSAVVRHAAKKVPLVLVFEDLHWVDPSSLVALVELAADSSSMTLLLLLTTRPTFQWPRNDQLIRVERLDEESSLRVVRASAGGVVLGADVELQITSRADGVPLFLEELTIAVVESGEVDSIPTTLQDSLAARLDRLGPARALAQIGALIGRDFDGQLLAAVANFAPDELTAGLQRLVDSGILSRSGGGWYAFKHALIQDAASDSLVRRTRRRLNSEIVDAIGTLFPAVVDSEPSRLGWHCVEAGRTAEAIGHYRRAAARASARLANQEATENLEKALALFAQLDDGDRTAKLEVELRAEYGGPLAARHGLLNEHVAANYRRLEQLESEATDLGDQLGALLALTVYYAQVTEMTALVKAGTRLLGIAEILDMPIFSAVGHTLCGIGGSSVLPSEITLGHLEAVETLAAQGHVLPPMSNYESDLQVLAASTKAVNLVLLGRVSEARERIDFSLYRAEVELAHPHSVGTALTLASNVHLELNEPELCLQTTSAAIEIARRHGFSHFEAMNLVQHGWARTATGDDGSDDIRLGLKLLATSTMSSYTHQVRVAALEALLRGNSQDARGFVDTATDRAVTKRERGYLTLLWRISAKIELAEGHPERAVPFLRDAVTTGSRAGHWLMVFFAALDLMDVVDYCDADYVHETLRSALAHLVGMDDHPDVIRASALLA